MSDENIVDSIVDEILEAVAVDSGENLNFLPVTSKRSTFSQTSTGGLCRICYDNLRYPIIYPCWCKGTMGAVHQPCLERWLEESNRSSCEVCGFVFSVERTPRHTALQSLGIFLRKTPRELEIPPRRPKTDLLRVAVLTLLTLATIYVFIVAGDFYSTNTFENFPPANWTNYSLIFLILLIVVSYTIWTVWTIDYQKNVWYWWWQKTSTVRMNFHRQSANERKNLNLN